MKDKIKKWYPYIGLIVLVMMAIDVWWLKTWTVETQIKIMTSTILLLVIGLYWKK